MPNINTISFSETLPKTLTLLKMLVKTLCYRTLKITWWVYWLSQNVKRYSKRCCRIRRKT